MVLGLHEFACARGHFVVKGKCVFRAYVFFISEAEFELDYAYYGIVYYCHEFRKDSFAHSAFACNLKRAYTFGLYEKLVGHGLWPQYAPRRSVVVEFVAENFTAAAQGFVELLVGVGHGGISRWIGLRIHTFRRIPPIAGRFRRKSARGAVATARGRRSVSC